MPAIEPMHQFLIHKVVELPPLQVPGLGALDLSITNSTVSMMVAAAIIVVFFALSAKGSIVPGRLQAVGEMLYDLIDKTLVGPMIGHRGKPFIPFVFTIFLLVLTMNMIGMFLIFTPTAQLAVTTTLALLTFITVLIIGFVRNGFGFFKLFVPSGVPIFILPLMVVIELISFMVRPVTLAMRLFGNMIGGHVVMNIFASFVVGLGLLGLTGGIATLGFVGSALSLSLVV